MIRQRRSPAEMPAIFWERFAAGVFAVLVLGFALVYWETRANNITTREVLDQITLNQQIIKKSATSIELLLNTGSPPAQRIEANQQHFEKEYQEMLRILRRLERRR